MLKVILPFLLIICSCNLWSSELIQSLEAVLNINNVLEPVNACSRCLPTRERSTFCSNPQQFVCHSRKSKMQQNIASYKKKEDLSFQLSRTFSIRQVQRFKQKLINVIRQQEFSAKRKETLIARVRQIEFITDDTNLSAELKNYFAVVCGVHGDEVNAAAVAGVGQTSNSSAIIVCPQLVKSYVAANSSAELAWRNLSFVLGHEVGHLMQDSAWDDSMAGDGELIGPSYLCWFSCLTKLKENKLLVPDNVEQMFSGDALDEYISDSNFRLFERFEEITADYWGSLILAEELKDLSLSNREHVVQIAPSILCLSQDDFVHPSARYRLNVILKQSGNLRGVLHCSSEKKQCRFETKTACQKEARDILAAF